MLLIVWAVTRFYIFPVDVIGSIYMGQGFVPDVEYFSFPRYFLTGMLYILLGLHVYWYILFLYIGYVFLVTGDTKDLQQQTIEKNLKNKKQN